ncbi:MAG: M17 family metallopeptidase [Alphaproteobacteria bacterium]
MTANLIARAKADTVPVTVVAAADYAGWAKRQATRVQAWLAGCGFSGQRGRPVVLPGADGVPAGAVYVPPDTGGPWAWAGLADGLPPGTYAIAALPKGASPDDVAFGWGLAGYDFAKYRKARPAGPQLVWPEKADRKRVTAMVEAATLVRDLVNTPAEDMGPSELAAAARAVARRHKAKIAVTAGDKLLAANYPMIHAVGRASDDAPRLIDIAWGRQGDPKLTLVGKGVCFDSGGLDIKTADGMLRMKKDMAGAAHALALGHLVMALGLRVRLRILVGAVENAISGNAFRPLDVLRSRKGLTVEVTNTDAEGRLVLGDCLAEASRDNPALLIDFATLTGAARVAVGTGLGALFCNDDRLAADFAAAGEAAGDPVWRLPLHQPYRRLIDSKVADLRSTSEGPFGGGITAALFLESFVGAGIPWAHLDIFAWNTGSRPGRPEGGEATGLFAAWGVVEQRFGRIRKR